MRPVWTFWTFHTAACRRHLEDPGATCICRDWSMPKEQKNGAEDLAKARWYLERLQREVGNG